MQPDSVCGHGLHPLSSVIAARDYRQSMLLPGIGLSYFAALQILQLMRGPTQGGHCGPGTDSRQRQNGFRKQRLHHLREISTQSHIGSEDMLG